MPACRNCGYVIDELDWDQTTECPRCGANPHKEPSPIEMTEEDLDDEQSYRESGSQQQTRQPQQPQSGGSGAPVSHEGRQETTESTESPSWAVASLVLGILVFLCGGITGPFALWAAIRSNRKGENSDMATAGLILGAIGTGLLVVAIIILFVPVLVTSISTLSENVNELQP